ncbi:MAG: alpha-N-arabinofuranosidase [Treponema sp.]|jgi:alpha-N-arabinofuranosidase|nr:alpha-N-arabinofuranosidase [Treponema sp.]
MHKAGFVVEKDWVKAIIDERLFSSFIEHLGRAVYQGIYEPNHPLADEQGFRKDVISLVKALHLPLIRYPGGNFLSGYHWKDGIGPAGERPVRLDLAWQTLESNRIGIGEFYDWTQKVGTNIMGCVNMGTGTPKEAGEFLEYCNFEKGTWWSDLRIHHGHPRPFGIKTWCIGNEMDGSWQICAMDAAEYGKKARETAKIMKLIDPSVELVVCGSSGPKMPSYPEWDRIILEHAYEQVDYLSLHSYYENFGNDDDFLASFASMDAFITAICATANYVKALKRSTKTMFLSFDEWNVWYQGRQQPRKPFTGTPASLLEDHYSLLDALVVGGLGITLLNNADRVKIACLAQLVNVIAPIMTVPGGSAFVQTTYYPFRDLSLLGRGKLLQPLITSPRKETCYGDVPVAPAAAVYQEEEGKLTIFTINTDTKIPLDLTVNLRSFHNSSADFWTELSSEDIHRKNSPEHPEAVQPIAREVTALALGKGVYHLRLKPASWNVLRFTLGEGDPLHLETV